jgi:hypothetical protein
MKMIKEFVMNITSYTAAQSAVRQGQQLEGNAIDKLLGFDLNAPKTDSLDALFGASSVPRPSAFESLFNPAGGSSFVDQVRDTKSALPTGLEAFANAPSKLETLAAQPSFKIAQARDGDSRRTITQPVTQILNYTSEDNEYNARPPITGTVEVPSTIRITVRVLRPDELGSLAGKSGQNLKNELTRASAQIDRENRANPNGKSTAELRQMASEYKLFGRGYYQSPTHQAWAKAAEARSGGKVPAKWWMENDPFGGTNGNGPAILPGGVYPADLSKIGMAHDTDWTLGRIFGAGPMRTLATSSDPRGDFGLLSQGANRAEYERALAAGFTGYMGGHPDWDVQYLAR